MKRTRSNSAMAFLGVYGIAAAAAHGHVELNSPNGGEQLVVGTMFTIQWEVAIEHDTENWDLEYSTESSSGPWQPVAMNLPAGDTSAGAIHTFTWAVPDVVDRTVWVRVTQDNGGTDYTDTSAAPFAIEPGSVCDADVNADGAVGPADLALVLQGWGPCEGLCPADIDGSGAVDAIDLAAILSAWGPC